LKKAKHGHQYC
jgi:hypothetical protein